MRRGWAVLFAILLLLGIAHIAWTASLKAAFEERLEAVRTSGAPIELAELNRDPVPPTLDAAPLLRRAVQRLRDDPNPSELDWYDLIDGEPIEQEKVDAAREWVAGKEPVFDLLEEAAGKPSLDFGVDWTSSAPTIVELIPTMQMVKDYLRWRAYLADSPEQATEGATVLFDLARKLERPSVVSCLVRWMMESQACEILERCAQKFGSVEHLGGRLAAAEDPRGAIDALVGERTRCLSLVREWASGETSPLLALSGEERDRTAADILATSPLCRVFAYGDGARALELFEEAIALHEREPWETLERVEGFGKRHNHGVPWVFSTLWRDLPARLAAERCRHLATLRVTDAGIALLAWREERGDWPATLADAGEWIDPFTGDPLLYAVEDDGSARIEAQWWLPFADDAEKIEFERSIGQDIAWSLPAR